MKMKKNGSIFIRRGEAARTRALATLKGGWWVFGFVVGTVASVYLRVYCLCLAFNLTMPKTYADVEVDVDDCAPSGDLQLSTLLALSVRRTDPPPLACLLSVCLPVCVVCARVLVILRLTFSLNPKPPPTPLHTPLSICCLPCATLKMAAFSRERWKARSECWWDRLSMCVCVCLGACMRAYLSSCPIQFLGLPHWAFPCPVWKPRFLRFNLFLDRLINCVLPILRKAAKSVGYLIFSFIINIKTFYQSFLKVARQNSCKSEGPI